MTQKSRLLGVVLGAILSGLITVFIGSSALACPDCPFPMRIGDHQWLMPNSQVVLDIQDTRLNTCQLQTRVILYHRPSGQVLAHGIGPRYPDQKQFKLTLTDPSGLRIAGEIFWVDFTTYLIQARFSCLDPNCSIAQEL